MKQAWFAVHILMYVSWPARLAADPICAHGYSGCRAPSLEDLLDRAIQQSARMQGVSNDLHSEIEQYFLPNKNHIGKRRCHTHYILSPADKENAQRLGREELTEVILRLLVAWEDPLSQLYHTMAQGEDQDVSPYGSNKALEMSDMVQELRSGVAKVAEKMQLLVVRSNSLSDSSSQESLDPSSHSTTYKEDESNATDHHNLLYCFRRDSNKVQSYLRLLKCSIFPELGC